MTKIDVIEADVLCIGGGIAGLMAAIRASELGARVVVAEKGNTLTSGAGGIGNDHFLCYLPEVHGPDLKPLVEELRKGQLGARLRDQEAVRVWLERTAEIVHLWDKWGIPMKYKGRYEFAGHAFPGDAYPCHLKYEGKRQKAVLTKEAVKRGAKIVNRVMVFELVADGAVTGAIGLHTRENRLIEFRANSVFLGTGTVSRLYQGLTPGWMSNATRPCTLSGDGRAMAYRAGAELFNVEALEHHAGPKYFSRSGQATWVGVVRDPQGRPVGPFVTKPDRKYGDMIIEVNKGLFSEYAQSGKGPVYMDCRGISKKDYDYMMHWFGHEGFDALTNHLGGKGIDLRKHAIEWATYGKRGSGGSILQSVKGETSMKGLYVAGDETTRSISPAATFGWIAGENAAAYAKGLDLPRPGGAKAKMKEYGSFLEELRGRQDGPDWREVNIALQQIMSDYAGSVRSETLLEAGLTHLRRLKREARATMIARNQHELTRSLEVLNLLDLGELVCIAARERKETRGQHVRPDYPYTNPKLDKLLIVKKVDGRPVTYWK
ncbi:MAG: FAD-binding protein [Desulfobacterales bacterium]|nr:FAD-binding protein [Desulfobacterales bacterium]